MNGWLRTGMLIAVSIVLSACNDAPTAEEFLNTVTVQFRYEAATSVDPAVAEQFADCVVAVERTSISPSWRDFPDVPMEVLGAETFRLTFTDVPAGLQQAIRVSDPNACALNATGSAVVGVYANDVLLTRVVDVPGDVAQPGLTFIVQDDGTVVP